MTNQVFIFAIGIVSICITAALSNCRIQPMITVAFVTCLLTIAASEGLLGRDVAILFEALRYNTSSLLQGETLQNELLHFSYSFRIILM